MLVKLSFILFVMDQEGKHGSKLPETMETTYR